MMVCGGAMWCYVMWRDVCKTVPYHTTTVDQHSLSRQNKTILYHTTTVDQHSFSRAYKTIPNLRLETLDHVVCCVCVVTLMWVLVLVLVLMMALIWILILYWYGFWYWFGIGIDIDVDIDVDVGLGVGIGIGIDDGFADMYKEINDDTQVGALMDLCFPFWWMVVMVDDQHSFSRQHYPLPYHTTIGRPTLVFPPTPYHSCRPTQHSFSRPPTPFIHPLTPSLPHSNPNLDIKH